RKKMLGKIKGECKVETNGRKNGNKKCSGDGENCNEMLPKNDGTVQDFFCPGCGKHCTSYRKWIKEKRKQFDEQSNAYEQQKKNCEKEGESAGLHNGGNGFCGTLDTCKTAGEFLEKLKMGPCKNHNDSEKPNGKDKIDFKNEDSPTFKHTDYCDPCPITGLKCYGNDCSKAKGRWCNGERITAKDINGSTEEVVMLVSDKSATTFPTGLGDCKSSGIFTGIRKDEWKCVKLCDVDVCGLKKDGNIDEKNIILINALLRRWLEYFLDDYIKIKRRISQCMIKEDGSTCISGCDKKCKCVGDWITKKKAEWKQMKDRYEKQYEKYDSGSSFSVKSFLQDLQSQIPVTIKKAIQPCPDLDRFQDSKDCNATGTQKDIIQCLLDKLQEKAKNCEEKPSGEPCTPSTTPQNLEDEEDLSLEEETETEETKKMMPNFCIDVVKTKIEPMVEETCDEPKKDEKKDETAEGDQETRNPAGPAPPEPSSSDDPNEAKDDSKDKAIQEEKAPPLTPAGPKKEGKKEKKPSPKTPYLSHPQFRQLLSASAFPWTVGVAFVALTYWLLKKKTKSSVDMLRVLQIPQNDYGMPTKTSANRYIPYKSAQYRGKRYIYIEGDSGTDSGYTDHYSDITSSSESEYEEFDINDIYVPHAPKYKTLIEVVLEPSGKTQNDIQSDDIPSDDIPIDNTPTNKLTDIEWNELKQNFISNMLQSEQPNDVPNDYTSGTTPTNTNNTTPSRDIVDNNTHPTMSRHNVDNNTHPTMSHDNVDKNTHPTPSRHTLDQKPFIMSIHDRNLLNGEEYSYDMINNIGNNDLYSGIDTINGNNDLYSDVDSTSGKHGSYSDNRGSYSDNRGPYNDNRGPYSGTDLINDSLNSGNHDIYDELLKRKENELFGTNHMKHTTSTHSVAKNANSDPITNQLELFHKWLDRHRDMCEKLGNKVDILNQLKEEWENDNNNSGNKTSGNITLTSDNTPPTSDITSGKLSDIPSDNKTLNTDVSIQIDMNNPKTTNIVDINPDKSTMDTILEDLDKTYNEPYYDVQDDMYYDVNDDNDTSTVNPNNMEKPSKVKIELDVNKKTIKEKYPIGDVWHI
ncbi:erythrocyte membrane protein 1, EMP1, partial [Plasmodium reichenowi]